MSSLHKVPSLAGRAHCTRLSAVALLWDAAQDVPAGLQLVWFLAQDCQFWVGGTVKNDDVQRDFFHVGLLNKCARRYPAVDTALF